MNKYVCENCGEEITREEFIQQGFNSICKICKGLNKKQRLQRAKDMFNKLA